MTKPIAYYVSDAEDAETIEEIATKYGAHLERINESQKITLLVLIAELLDINKVGVIPEELSNSLDSLSNDTLLGLLIATAQQLRDDK